MTLTNTHADAKDRTLIVTPEVTADSIRMQKCMLLAVSGPLHGDEFIVEKDSFTLGSGPHNDVCIRDSTVSRRHCEIQLTADGYTIRDLGSTNGTVVRGVKVAEAFLTQGAEVQLGGTKLVFCPLQESMELSLSRDDSFGAMLGRSVAMRRVFHIAETYAPTDATVLIEGETGTGKEVLAEEIHRHSRRRDRPFIVIDCAALAHELIESELFGHTKGAFTGASQSRTGAFEHADGGTVFLDEISELSPELQPKLLRVLEKRQVRRVGSNEVRPIDVRIVSATNRKLENEVNRGTFREDLYYRLSVVHLELPPLRKRKEDIAPLAQRFFVEFRGKEGLDDFPEFERMIEGFRNHDWPGNVRELRNLCEVACYAGSEHRPVDLAALLYLGRVRSNAMAQQDTGPAYAADRPFKDAKGELIARFERDYIRDLMEQAGGNVSRAARQAGIERAYMQRLLRKYGMK